MSKASITDNRKSKREPWLNWTAKDAKSLASANLYLSLSALVYLLAIPFSATAQVNMKANPEAGLDALMPFALLLLGTAFILFVIGGTKSAKPLGDSIVVSVLCAILLLIIPCGYLIGAVALISRFNRAWQAIGVPVGMMGPNAKALDEVVKRLERGEPALAGSAVKQDTASATAVQTPAASVVVDDAAFQAWIDTLDRWLSDSGLPTRSTHFHPEAIKYGYAMNMNPQDFVREGYNKREKDIKD